MKKVMSFKGWFLVVAALILGAGSVSYAQNIFPGSGNVGIGTTNPTRAFLEIRGDQQNDDQRLFSVTARDTNGQLKTLDIHMSAGTPEVLVTTSAVGPDPRLSFSTAGAAGQLTLNTNGNVGIGTTNPRRARLQIQGAEQDEIQTLLSMTANNSAGQIKALDIRFNAGTPEVLVTTSAVGPDPRLSFSTAGAAAQLTLNTNGDVGIGTGSPTSKLHVSGNAKFDGSVTGTNIAAQYQDVAEWVPVGAAVAPGTVVTINPSETNRVRPSTQAYDTRIAGVISLKPGILLGEAGEGKAKVATAAGSR